MFYKEFFSLCGRMLVITSCLCGSAQLCICVDWRFLYLTVVLAAQTPLVIWGIVLRARGLGSRLAEPLPLAFSLSILIASSLLMLAGFTIPVLIERTGGVTLSELWDGTIRLPFFMASCSLQAVWQVVMKAQDRASSANG